MTLAWWRPDSHMVDIYIQRAFVLVYQQQRQLDTRAQNPLLRIDVQKLHRRLA